MTRLSERLQRRRRRCVWDQGIDDNDGGFGRGRLAQGFSNNTRVVGKGQGIDDASKEPEAMTEAEGDRQKAQGIYDDDGGDSGGI